MDDTSSVEGVQGLVLDEVPEVGDLIASSRSAERTVRRDSDGVEVAAVTSQILDQLAVSQAPDLDLFVPSTRHNDGVGVARREFDARRPEGVVLLGDGEFALSKGVPKTDGAVSRGRDDLTVVGREGNREDFFGVALETTSCGSGLEIPQTESVIPRGREGEQSVRGDNNILNEVRVSGQGFTRISVVSLFVSQIPNENASVS